MKLQTKYLLTYLSSTLITLIVGGISLFYFHQLYLATDYLITTNDRVLELASLFEKDLAQSRSAEKEFFIFPDNEEKQNQYAQNWLRHMDRVKSNLDRLEELFIKLQKKDLLNKVIEARSFIRENEADWKIIVANFKALHSFEAVEQVEYGKFMERTRSLLDIGAEITAYGQAEVNNGRKQIRAIRQQAVMLIKIVSGAALFGGIVIPILFSGRMTRTILYLNQVADDISKGKINKEIIVDRKDELGDLAASIKRMQTSLRIMLERVSKKKT